MVCGDILAALADDDGNFTFVVEAPGAFRIRNLVVRTCNLMGIFPKSPLTLLFGQLGDLCQVSSDTGTSGPHTGEMRGVVAAHARDAAIGPGRVELNTLDIVDNGFHASLGRMLDSEFSIFDCCCAQRNETLQSRWDFFVGVRLRVGPAVLVA